MRRILCLLIFLLAGCRAPALQSLQESSVQADTPGPPPTGTLQVTFLDVGQGDATLVQVPGGTSVLIDGGPSGEGPVVVDALRRAGISKLDWIVASHPHEDHIGGLIDVLEAVPAATALDSGYNHGTATQKKYLSLLKQVGAEGKLARAGGRYELGSGAVLEILAPQLPLLTGTDSDPNNNSIVARLVFGESEFLFTGDMEEDERARLMQGSPEELRADVLKVAHHGSRNGTDAEFLRRVRPEYAVISCGKGNDYGHPHREALEALRAAGCRILRTDESGSITFRTDGRKLELTTGSAPAGTAAPGPTPRPRESRSSDSGAPDVQGKVIGNRESKVFHTPGCEALPDPERRITLASAAAARQAGYRPHKACIKE